MTKLALRLTAAQAIILLGGVACVPAHAASGDLLIKATGNYSIRAGNDTLDFTVDGLDVSAKPQGNVGGQVSMALFFTDMIAVEAALGGSKLDFKNSEGRSVMSTGSVIPALSVQVYPAGTEKRLRPFVGAGIAYYKFYSAEAGEVLTNRPTSLAMPQHNDRITLESKVVPIMHAGVDLAVSPSAFLTLEGRYAGTTTKINVATATLTTTRPIQIKNVALSLGAGFRF